MHADNTKVVCIIFFVVENIFGFRYSTKLNYFMHYLLYFKVEFAKTYASKMLKEFLETYGLELMSLRNTLDRYGDTPPPV